MVGHYTQHEAQVRLVQSVVILGQEDRVVEACIEGKELLFQPEEFSRVGSVDSRVLNECTD